MKPKAFPLFKGYMTKRLVLTSSLWPQSSF